jgi:hypothetical protein
MSSGKPFSLTNAAERRRFWATSATCLPRAIPQLGTDKALLALIFCALASRLNLTRSLAPDGTSGSAFDEREFVFDTLGNAYSAISSTFWHEVLKSLHLLPLPFPFIGRDFAGDC